MSDAVQAQVASSAALGTVVVTATRSPMQAAELTSDVLVITREDILSQTGIGDIADLLRNSGAVEFARTGSPGQPTSIFIRGANSEHTLVMIDGVRLDSQSISGGALWESIPLNQIDHVEVVKGPSSALYGSDAIGGVIQIFTLKGTGAPEVELGVAGGSLGTASMDGNVRGKTGILDYALAASTAHSDGMLLSPNPSSPYYSPDRAPYQKHSWSARLGAQLDAADRIEFISLASHLNADFNTGFPPPYEAADLEDISTEKLSWSRRWSAALNTQLSVGQSDTRNSFPIFAYQSETRVRSYALEGSYALAAHQQLLFVLERREDRLNSSDIAGTGIGQRNENGAALGYVWSSGPLDVQAHARHDQDSEFGGVNTGNLGLGYKLSPNLKLIGSVSNAFRAPTLDENLGSSGPLSLPGGTSLLAETSHNSEVGLKYADSHAEWSVIAFRNKVENLINFSASTDSCASFAAFGGCYGNVQEARLQGLSFSGALQWDKLHLSGNLNLQAPKDLSTGLLLPRRAREFGALRAETQLQGWELGSTLQFAGRRYDDAANTMEMGGYALLNIDAGYRLNRDLKLQLNLDNAFNRAYQTAYNYNQLPRTLMVGLRYTPAIPAF